MERLTEVQVKAGLRLHGVLMRALDAALWFEYVLALSEADTPWVKSEMDKAYIAISRYGRAVADLVASREGFAGENSGREVSS